MELRALGGLEIIGDDGRPAALGPPKQRLLLAVLMCRLGAMVPLSELVEALWGQAPPPSATANLRSYVHRLRRILGAEALRGNGRPGYRLDVDAASVDLARFCLLANLVEATLAAGDVAQARAALHDALSLWRGEPFADLDDVPLLAGEAARLRERWITMVEHRIVADLDTGQSGGLVSELTTLVQEHPYRERLWAQLMLALYRSGRQADALAAYRKVWQLLATDLGIEPGPELRDLHEAMLTGHSRLDTPSGVEAGPAASATTSAAPAQLPADTGQFVGRDRELTRLSQLTAPPEQGGQTGPAIVAIVGTAGVGKTALAVHWGHLHLGMFPGGQLYLDLRGFHTGPAMSPAEGVARFLRALGVPPDRVPAAPDEAAALYRSTLSARPALVVLDNAASAEQVRPLLPGSPGCVVLVTSRRRLPALVARDGARHLALGPLERPAAAELIRRIVRSRAAREPGAVAELAVVCDHLPLALRIAAANLAERPACGVGELVAELRQGNRVDALRVEGDDEFAVRAAFDLSYAALRADQRRLFRLLGLVPGPDITPAAAAALAACPGSAAEDGLRRLAAAHLVQRSGKARFTLHDLIREYARARAQADEPDGGKAALTRLFEHYVRCADRAALQLYPQLLRLPSPQAQTPDEDAPASNAEALAWLTAESANLVAACRHAADHGPYPVAWRLADALRGFWWHARSPVEWAATARAAAQAAHRAPDPMAQAAAELNLGHLHRFLGNFAESTAHDNAALDRCRRLGWQDAESAVLSNIATTYGRLGDFPRAVQYLRAAQAVNRSIGRRTGEAVDLNNLGVTVGYLGRLDEARELLAASIALFERNGRPGAEVQALINLAEVLVLMGRHTQARALIDQSRAVGRAVGRIDAEIEALVHLSTLCRDAGDVAAAVRHATEAVRLIPPSGDPLLVNAAHQALAAAYTAGGDYPTALAHLSTAHQVAADVHSRYHETRTAIRLTAVEHRLGDANAASALDDLIGLTRSGGYRLLEGEALAALARICLDQRNYADAQHHARQVLDIQHETGWRQGQRRLLGILDATLQNATR